MLRLAEEIMLLLLPDGGGRIAGARDRSVGYAIAGSVLVDLAFEERIDTDLQRLMLLDATPTGDDLLDPTLADIASAEGTFDTRHWLERGLQRVVDTRAAALARLVERGILERRANRLLWVFGARRYPLVDGEAQREVKLRILDILLGDGIPDARDAVVICLADACGLFRELFSARELDQALPRFERIRKLDLVGRAVTAAVADLDREAAAQTQFMIEQAPERPAGRGELGDDE